MHGYLIWRTILENGTEGLMQCLEIQHIKKNDQLQEIFQIICSDIDSIATENTDTQFQSATISHLEDLSHSILTYNQIRSATTEDQSYTKLKTIITQGFPDNRQMMDPNLKDFWEVPDRLSHAEDIIYLDKRIVIPQKFRKQVLEHLHSAHQGVTGIEGSCQPVHLLARYHNIN